MTTIPHRDLANPEVWQRSLERSRHRRELAPQARREVGRRKRVSAAMATAMLAGPGAPLAAAQASSGVEPALAAESPANRAIEVKEGGLPLQLGSRGELVVQVQRALGVHADGVFGEGTDGAVRRFQYVAKLEVDGVVGPATWSALLTTPRSAGAGPAARPALGGARVPHEVRRAIERKLESAGRSLPERRVGGGPAKSPAITDVRVGDCGATRISAPVRGTVTSNFGPRGGRNHDGIDIAAPAGTAVRAAACGVVTIRGSQSGYGNIVCITHTSRFATCYAHLSRFATSRGARVRQGQTIGYVGCTGHCTGPHLHFETRVDGSARDPRPYLSGREMPGAPQDQPREATTSTSSTSSTSTGTSSAGTATSTASSGTSTGAAQPDTTTDTAVSGSGTGSPAAAAPADDPAPAQPAAEAAAPQQPETGVAAPQQPAEVDESVTAELSAAAA